MQELMRKLTTELEVDSRPGHAVSATLILITQMAGLASLQHSAYSLEGQQK